MKKELKTNKRIKL